MNSVREILTGPEKLLNSYDFFFEELKKLGVHGTSYIYKSPIREDNELDEHCTGFVLQISNNNDEIERKVESFIKSFNDYVEAEREDIYSYLFPSVVYDTEPRKEAIRYDF